MQTLVRLLHLFIRLRKHNYVLVTSFWLSSIDYFAKSTSASVFAKLLPSMSSEDLEVFHSIARAVTRHWDIPEALSRKLLYLAVTRAPPTEEEEETEMEQLLGHFDMMEGKRKTRKEAAGEEQHIAVEVELERLFRELGATSVRVEITTGKVRRKAL